MTAAEALDLLVRFAGATGLPPGNILQWKTVILNELQNGSAQEVQALQQQIKSLKAERAGQTIRIAELEDQLIEAKKPKRRTTRKKNATTNDNDNS